MSLKKTRKRVHKKKKERKKSPHKGARDFLLRYQGIKPHLKRAKMSIEDDSPSKQKKQASSDEQNQKSELFPWRMEVPK